MVIGENTMLNECSGRECPCAPFGCSTPCEVPEAPGTLLSGVGKSDPEAPHNTDRLNFRAKCHKVEYSTRHRQRPKMSLCQTPPKPKGQNVPLISTAETIAQPHKTDAPQGPPRRFHKDGQHVTRLQHDKRHHGRCGRVFGRRGVR